MKELRFRKNANEPKYELRFETKADRELRKKKEADAEAKLAEPAPERGPKIDTSLYKAAHGKKPKAAKHRAWAFSLDGSRNGSVWFLGDYDDAAEYAKSRFAGAPKVFVLP